MPIASLPEGTKALMDELSIGEVMRLIERTARWVAPETFDLLPVWYPEHARKAAFYKANWSEPQMNKDRETGEIKRKSESNVHANKALTQALCLHSSGRKGWSCCHIWGVDDQTNQQANLVVQDPRFFSCVANVVLLPTPLKAFTDSMPKVKSMLRLCARNTYDWQCDHTEMTSINADLDNWHDWENYPASWPKKPREANPMGTILLNSDIQKRANRRWRKLQSDMENAGAHYPRESVRQVLDYWHLDLGAPLSSARKSR